MPVVPRGDGTGDVWVAEPYRPGSYVTSRMADGPVAWSLSEALIGLGIDRESTTKLVDLLKKSLSDELIFEQLDQIQLQWSHHPAPNVVNFYFGKVKESHDWKSLSHVKAAKVFEKISGT